MIGILDQASEVAIWLGFRLVLSCYINRVVFSGVCLQ